MASAVTRAAAAAALLFSFSAVVFLFLLLLAPPRSLAELLVSVLDRFLDGRALLELATRRNMILLCHAILLLILRDAGVLGAPASLRRIRTPPGEPTVAVSAAGGSTTVPAPARSDATRSAVVIWRQRRPRNRAVVAPMHVHEYDAADRVVECRPAAEAAVTWDAPVLTTCPPAMEVEEAAAVATKQIILAESPRDDNDELLDRHDRASIVEPREHPTAIVVDGERDDCDDRRIIAVAADDDVKRMDNQTAGMEMETELADDRTFEEFIKSQRRQMRQESLRLVRSDCHYQAMATCY